LRNRDDGSDGALTGRIRQLRERVETALSNGQQMEI
jgi:hypothetical protein